MFKSTIAYLSTGRRYQIVINTCLLVALCASLLPQLIPNAEQLAILIGVGTAAIALCSYFLTLRPLNTTETNKPELATQSQPEKEPAANNDVRLAEESNARRRQSAEEEFNPVIEVSSERGDNQMSTSDIISLMLSSGKQVSLDVAQPETLNVVLSPIELTIGAITITLRGGEAKISVATPEKPAARLISELERPAVQAMTGIVRPFTRH